MSAADTTLAAFCFLSYAMTRFPPRVYLLKVVFVAGLWPDHAKNGHIPDHQNLWRLTVLYCVQIELSNTISCFHLKIYSLIEYGH